MRVHREDLGTVANTVASNYWSDACSPCVVGHVCWRTSTRKLYALAAHGRAALAARSVYDAAHSVGGS